MSITRNNNKRSLKRVSRLNSLCHYSKPINTLNTEVWRSCWWTQMTVSKNPMCLWVSMSVLKMILITLWDSHISLSIYCLLALQILKTLRAWVKCSKNTMDRTMDLLRIYSPITTMKLTQMEFKNCFRC